MISRRAHAIIEYLTAAIIALVIIFTGTAAVHAEEAWSGAGTESDPYLIGSYSDLAALSAEVGNGNSFEGKYFSLTADINLSADWDGIGTLKSGETSAANGKNILPFSGTLDGSGFTVTSADGGKALFGYVRGAVIENLCIAGTNINGSGLIRNYVVDYGESGSYGVHTATIRNVTIKSGTSVTGSGFVSGYASAGNTVDIVNCTAEEGVIIGSGKNREKIGSFGGDFNGTVIGCKSAATVYGTNYVGGIIGCKGNSMNDTRISGCTFTGNVIASGSYAGGIAGGGYGGTRWGIASAPNGMILSVQSCLSIGDVTAGDFAGGIVGFETTVQPWTEGYIRSNLFAGHVSAAEGGTAGAIVGMFRGMDKLTYVKDNYYSENCGADRGIGKVQYLDTSCKNHETTYGENYFDSSSGNIPVFPGVNDVYPHNIRENYNRADDPLGADAESLAKSVTYAELRDGTVTELLNNASGSSQNWSQGVNTPILEAGKEIVSISIEPGYRDEYETRAELDRASMTFVLTWTDDTTSTLQGSDDNIDITGFDSSKEGTVLLTARYRTVYTSFTVRIVKGPDIPVTYDTVYFTLMGDSLHGEISADEVHTRSKGNLTEWIPATEYVVLHGSTAKDVIVRALEDAGLEIKGSFDNVYGSFYISGIQVPGSSDILYEKDNGVDSGWMYAVNDEEPAVGVGEYVLDDGDEIVLFYTDNYKIEKSAVGQDEVDKLRAGYVSELIENLPDVTAVTLDDKDKLSIAETKYNALSQDQKALVPVELRNKLEKLIQKIAEMEGDQGQGSQDKDDSSSDSDSDSKTPDGGGEDQKDTTPDGGKDDSGSNPSKQDDSSGSGGDDSSGSKEDESGSKGGESDGGESAPGASVIKGGVYTAGGSRYKVIKTASAKSGGTAALIKAKNVRKFTVPASIRLSDGRLYKVVQINAGSFKSKKVKTVTIGKNIKKIKKNALKASKVIKLIVKTKKLKKSGVKGALKASKVKTVIVKIGSKKINSKYVKKYRKIFTKKNAGRKVKVR